MWLSPWRSALYEMVRSKLSYSIICLRASFPSSLPQEVNQYNIITSSEKVLGYVPSWKFSFWLPLALYDRIYLRTRIDASTFYVQNVCLMSSENDILPFIASRLCIFICIYINIRDFVETFRCNAQIILVGSWYTLVHYIVSSDKVVVLL